MTYSDVESNWNLHGDVELVNISTVKMFGGVTISRDAELCCDVSCTTHNELFL